AIIQSFPLEYKFAGSQSSVFKQIGNAVPCNLGYAIALMIKESLETLTAESMLEEPIQLQFRL
ncbi:MAG: DNA cytosine methyltransferase, partial [Chloroflexi bacterium]|nr:DNA cytosine methyltransferase [Chloroflexota bacterium]